MCREWYLSLLERSDTVAAFQNSSAPTQIGILAAKLFSAATSDTSDDSSTIRTQSENLYLALSTLASDAWTYAESGHIRMYEVQDFDLRQS